MATYYKYQKRDEGAQIDWATIGKNISDGLFEEVKVREQKKEKIQKDTNEAITFLNEYELGSSQSANQFIMNSSAQARDYLSMQNKLLKQGALKPSDYNLGMQTLKDDYTQLSTAMKNFNTTYSEALGNLNDPSKKASKQYEKLMERYFGFADLSNKTTVVNPVDGRLYIATIGKDGQIDKNPSKLMSVSSIQNQASPFLGEYDLNGAVKTFVDTLGEYVVAGEILTKSSIKQNDSYKEAENDAVKAIVGASPTQTASILADHSDYSFVFEGGECDQKNKSKCIKLVAQENGVFAPELTEEQRDEAERIVRTKIDVGIDEVNARQKQSAYENTYIRQEGEKTKALGTIYDLAYNLTSSDAQQRKDAREQLLSSRDLNITDIDQTKDGKIILKIEDKRLPAINLRNIDKTPKGRTDVAQMILRALEPGTITDQRMSEIDKRYSYENTPTNYTFTQDDKSILPDVDFDGREVMVSITNDKGKIVEERLSNVLNKEKNKLTPGELETITETLEKKMDVVKNDVESVFNDLRVGRRDLERYSFVVTPSIGVDPNDKEEKILNSMTIEIVKDTGERKVIGDLKNNLISEIVDELTNVVQNLDALTTSTPSPSGETGSGNLSAPTPQSLQTQINDLEASIVLNPNASPAEVLNLRSQIQNLKTQRENLIQEEMSSIEFLSNLTSDSPQDR